MTEESAPLVDPRSAQDISRQLRKLLAGYAPQWMKGDAGADVPEGLSAAIIGIFSRFSEIVIHRLNKTPEKNLLAYLDLLGLSVLPPQPARVPLTFSLAAGSLTDAVVPAGTQVATKPAEGETEPAVFETERELTVVAARLDAALTRDPAQDAYADLSDVIRAAADPGAQVFSAETPLEHTLYVGHERFLSHPALKELRVSFQLAQALTNPKPRQLAWESWDGKTWALLFTSDSGGKVTPAGGVSASDATRALTKGGEVVLTGLPAVPPTSAGGREGRWLRVRLTTKIPPADFKPAGGQAAQLPTVNGVRLSARLERALAAAGADERLAVEAAFSNYAPADASKSFFPFGEKPRAGDALYLAQSEAFSAEGATVTLDINLTRPQTNPATNKAYDTPVVAHAWEFWDGRRWALLLTSDSGGAVKDNKGAAVAAGRTPADTTLAFRQSGRVTFTFPAAPARTAVNGVENFWVRVRILSGDYGREAYYALKPNTNDQYVLAPATFAPPAVDALAVGYNVTTTEPPDAVVAANDFTHEPFTGDGPFEPFKAADDTPVSLYLGFTLPAGRRSFPNRLVSLYVGVDDYLRGRRPDVASPASPPRLVWEYSAGPSWSKLTVFDGTADLTRAGLLEFLAPANFAPRREFGRDCYWLRVGWASGQYQFNPRVRSLALNTVMAAQTQTVRGEVLGSSDASASQKFSTTAAPILAGQRLEVREPDRPSAEERARLESEGGPDAVEETLDETGRPLEIWVRWHEVSDFYGSGARDRHYVVNHLTGEVQFGDGLNGMIPPRGAGNLRLSLYQTGGGRAGNRPAGTVTEMKTTVPYIDGVVNREPADGGADAESLDSLISRGPRAIRHRDRAVTAQDYEDLAMMASSGVARVKCYPLQDLAVGLDTKQLKPGVVSLVVVPVSTDAKPYPHLELLDAVRSHVERRRAAEGRLVLVGPKYIGVTVLATVVPETGAEVSRLEGGVVDALSRFLHPLTGGPEGEGWNFGRKPQASDVYAVIESVAGVRYVRRLQLSGSKEAEGGGETPVDLEKLADGQDYFLVYSGEHKIELVFD